ncbi:nitrogen utilization protein B [Gardnerella vaginalis]|uniref:transcription antitermination factor NusB n=1 Tax=Gardnerella TaxID=2701 RepID=UPI0006616C7D|nr:transcription antitermination factor NusB [Gardnerella vaginalis]KMT46556.1 nitrogen utilization protein B [Gardnerella vaginalis]RFT40185.1 transcription antitermination factor NusB [Gardnerella vaginalis]
MARSTARKRALNTLYEADEKNQNILSLLEERLKEPGAQTPLPDYAVDIIRGVGERRNRIDKTLNRYSTGWKVGRMAVIDRNILRIAVWEILLNDEVPDKVAIDEAISLAKMYSDDDAIAFIHGLLSAIMADKEACLAKFNGEASTEDTAGEVNETEAADSSDVEQSSNEFNTDSVE